MVIVQVVHDEQEVNQFTFSLPPEKKPTRKEGPEVGIRLGLGLAGVI